MSKTEHGTLPHAISGNIACYSGTDIARADFCIYLSLALFGFQFHAPRQASRYEDTLMS